MTDRSEKELQAAIDKGDKQACLRWFDGAKDSDRRRAAKAVETALERLADLRWLEQPDGTNCINPAWACAVMAAFACYSLSDIKKERLHLSADANDVVSVIKLRRPVWVESWVTWLLESNRSQWTSPWRLVERLVEAGLCSRPSGESYMLAMIYGVDKSTLGQQLEAFEVEVWRLFDVEGSGEFSLAAHDKYTSEGDSWAVCLASLSDQQLLSRDRLLDASLDALQRDFAQFRAGWFSRFHQRLEPTLDETAARATKYLHLLGSSIGPTVSFALQAVLMLAKHGRITPIDLVDSLSPVLASTTKSIAKQGLRLLRMLPQLSGEPPQTDTVLKLAATALLHSDPGIQSLALQLMTSFGAEDGGAYCDHIASEIEPCLPAMAPSVRKEAKQWLKQYGGGQAAGRAADANGNGAVVVDAPIDLEDFDLQLKDVPQLWQELAGVPTALLNAQQGNLKVKAINVADVQIPRLAEVAPVAAVETLEDLIDLASRTLESLDPTSVSAMLDGVSRLCDERPDNFEVLVGPLRKRAWSRWKSTGAPFTCGGPAADSVGVVLLWLNDPRIKPDIRKLKSGKYKFACQLDDWTSKHASGETHATTEIQCRYFYEVARRAADHVAQPLLSAPTHEEGWVEAQILADRFNWLAEHAREPSDLDFIFALLRLAPDQRLAAAGRIGALPKRASTRMRELRSALLYAMGAPRIAIGATASYWIAASRSRDPYATDARLERKHGSGGPETTTPASFAIESTHHRTSYKKEGNYNLVLRPSVKYRRTADADWVTVQFFDDREPLGGYHSSVAAWLRTIRPTYHEPLFAAAAARLSDNLDWWEAAWWNREFLLPLLDPNTPLLPMARLVLVLGLAAKEPSEHGLAVDAAIQAIDDRRLDGEILGEMLQTMLSRRLVKGARLGKTLTEVARAGSLHGFVVREALERSLRGDPSAAGLPAKEVDPSAAGLPAKEVNPSSYPRDVHALLVLLKELSIEAQIAVTSSGARQFLENITGSGKGAKAAKALLAIDGAPESAYVAEVTRLALENSVARARRWSEKEGGKDNR